MMIHVNHTSCWTAVQVNTDNVHVNVASLFLHPTLSQIDWCNLDNINPSKEFARYLGTALYSIFPNCRAGIRFRRSTAATAWRLEAGG